MAAARLRNEVEGKLLEGEPVGRRVPLDALVHRLGGLPFATREDDPGYAADLQLDALIGGETRYITIHTDAAPPAANEQAGDGYARRTVASAGWTKSTVAGFRRIANTDRVDFPQPSGAGWPAGSLACWTDAPGNAGAELLWHVDRPATPTGVDAYVPAGAFGYEIALAE